MDFVSLQPPFTYLRSSPLISQSSFHLFFSVFAASGAQLNKRKPRKQQITCAPTPREKKSDRGCRCIFAIIINRRGALEKIGPSLLMIPLVVGRRIFLFKQRCTQGRTDPATSTFWKTPPLKMFI